MPDLATFAELYAASLRAMLAAVVPASETPLDITAEVEEQPPSGLVLRVTLRSPPSDSERSVQGVGTPFDLMLGLSEATALGRELTTGEPVSYPLSTLYLSADDAPASVASQTSPRLAGACAEMGGLLLGEQRAAEAEPLIRLALMIASAPASDRVPVPRETSQLVEGEDEAEEEARETPGSEQQAPGASSAPRSAPFTLSIVECVVALMRQRGIDAAEVASFFDAARAAAVPASLCQSSRYLALARQLRTERSLGELRDRHLAFIDQSWDDPPALLCACSALGGLLRRVHDERSRMRIVSLLHGPVFRGVGHDDPLVRHAFRELGRSWLTHHLLGLPDLEDVALRVFDRVFPHVAGVPLVAWRQRGRNFPGVADLVERAGDRATAERLRRFSSHCPGLRP